MTPAALLRQLNALSHADRMRRLVEVGRESRSDPRLAAALDAFEEGSFFERYWSLHACFGSRDVARILRRLGDPSRKIRRRAARLMVLFAPDNDILHGLASLSRRHLLGALGQLRKAGRLAPIDAHLDELARRGDRSLEVLLPYGSEKALDRYIDRAAERGGAVFHARLARLHPHRALKLLDDRLASARRADPELTRLAKPTLAVLAKRLPDEAVGAFERASKLTPLGQLPFVPLLQRRPRQLAELVLRTKGHGVARGTFNAVAPRLPRELVIDLAKKRLINLTASSPYGYGGKAYRWLHRLDPALRGELFTMLVGDRPQSAVDINLLPLMPDAIRRREGARCLGLKKFALNPAARLPSVAFLDWDEARAKVEPQLTHPDGAQRALAIAALAGVVKFQRHRAADYLALVRARQFEQDPVRLAMLGALGTVPVSVWRTEHLADLGGAIREALNARDLSHGTAAAAVSLVVRLLPRHTDWAAEWLTTLARERGALSWYGLEQVLTDDDVRRVGAALLPVLKAWRKSERDAQMLQLASSLGKRLRVFSELLDLIEALARTTRESYLAQNCINLIARHAPARMAELVPRLLREDKSWIVFGEISSFLHRRRQDLLTPFLDGKPVRGRFSTGKTRLILTFTGGFERWNAQQAVTYAETLRAEVERDDPDSPVVDQATCLRSLAAIPGIKADVLAAVASDDKRPALRDRALSLLGSLEDGSGVMPLLDALGDQRARVAIYALRTAFLGMTPAHVLDLLRRAPMKKVTVAKEVVRLVGEMDSDEAFAFLAQLESGKLHRDVRGAILRAVWTHLDRDESWAMIDRAVESGDPALMDTVVRIPADRLSRPARTRLVNLLARLLDHPEPSVRLGVLQRIAQEPPNDPGRVLLGKSLEALGSELSDLRRWAGLALSASMSGTDADLIASAARTLQADRQAIHSLVSALTAALRYQKGRLGAIGRAVQEVMADDPILASLRLQLAQASMSGRHFASLLAATDAGGWRPDVLTTALHLVQAPGESHSSKDLNQMEADFARSNSVALRRLALAALTAQAQRTGWDAKKVARLERFRGDADALVAAAAQFTFTEEDEEVEEDWED